MGDVTRLLQRLSEGDRHAEPELYEHIYSELKKIATIRLSRERQGHTLQATALVNEAYMRLVQNREVEWKGRTHFLALAARSMRRILSDHARSRNAVKRGGGVNNIPLDLYDGSPIISNQQSELIADLDEALQRLAAFRPKWAAVVEMRFFGGLTEDQIAELEGCSTRTVKRNWEKAQAWLKGELATPVQH
jgi:RNA polymerase sigma-70 factor (ECF subfamily)